MTQPNRRKEPRAKASIRFWYRMPWSRVWHSARTQDLGPGGLSFQLPKGFCFKGLPIEVAVDVPTAAFRSRTKVVRTTKDESGRQVGVRFVDLPQHLREKLGNYIDRLRRINVTGLRRVFSL